MSTKSERIGDILSFSCTHTVLRPFWPYDIPSKQKVSKTTKLILLDSLLLKSLIMIRSKKGDFVIEKQIARHFA